MRCPKCGYISFDHLDTCKKCRKGAIALVSEQITGTVYDSTLPSFLVLEQGSEVEAMPEEAAEAAAEVDELLLDEPDDDDFILALGEEEVEEEPDVAAVEEEVAEEEEDIVLSLDELDETSSQEEFTLDLGEGEQVGEEEGPTFDFSELDISDLMPPGEEPAEAAVQESGASIEMDELELPFEPEPETSAAPPKIEEELPPVPDVAPSLEQPAEKDATGGLEDLLLDEIELDTVAAASGAKDAVSPVKTGTALDNFDVDLGELFKDDEE